MGRIITPTPKISDRREIRRLRNVILHPGPTAFALPHPRLPGETPDGVVLETDGSIAAIAHSSYGRLMDVTPERPLDATRLQGVESTERLEGETWFFGGLLRAWFGHFLAQSTGRLWAVGAYPEVENIVFFVEPYFLDRLRRGWSPLDAAWLRDFLTMLGFKRVHLVSQPTFVEDLIVPCQDGPRFGWNGRHELYDNGARRKLLAATTHLPDCERVYLSRRDFAAGRGGTGGILLESLIEENLQRAGYKIVLPETLTMAEQVSVMRSVRKLVCADISPLHLFALVADPTQEVAIIGRRPPGATYFVQQLNDLGFPVRSLFPLLSNEQYFWRPQKMLDMAVLDFPAIGTFLEEQGFIDQGTWRNPSPDDWDAARSEVSAWSAARRKACSRGAEHDAT